MTLRNKYRAYLLVTGLVVVGALLGGLCTRADSQDWVDLTAQAIGSGLWVGALVFLYWGTMKRLTEMEKNDADA